MTPATSNPVRIDPQGFYDDCLLYAALELSTSPH
jgi:hypothetical protein